MTTATVTSKGQVTIPAEVRRRLGLHAGSRLTFVPNESGGFEVHAETGSIRDLEGCLPAPRGPVSIEDMNAAIAQGASDSGTA